MPKYTLVDCLGGEQETIDAEDIEEAEKLAEKWILAWLQEEADRNAHTEYSDCRIFSSDEDSYVQVIAHPRVPCVEDKEHDWIVPYELLGGCKENPGVWGHGGGVIMKAICRHCGKLRTIDTWYQRHDNGAILNDDYVKYEDDPQMKEKLQEWLRETGQLTEENEIV